MLEIVPINPIYLTCRTMLFIFLFYEQHSSQKVTQIFQFPLIILHDRPLIIDIAHRLATKYSIHTRVSVIRNSNDPSGEDYESKLCFKRLR